MYFLISLYSCNNNVRAWITLEYHQIPYEYVESLSVEKDQMKGNHGYTKNPRLLQLNPKGLVPTLELSDDLIQLVKSSEGQSGKNLEAYPLKPSPLNDAGSTMHVLSESIDCIEFLNALKLASSHDEIVQNLMPDSSFVAKAHVMNQNICSTFYKVLMKPTREEQKEAFDFFAKSIDEFISKVNQNGYFDSNTLTIVDITVIPWILRLPLLRHYRPMFKIEDVLESDNVTKLNDYVERIKSLPSVKATLWNDHDKLIEVYARYAEGTATSQVGQAVKSGMNAHDV
jgi:glutathione S-transferase